MSGKRHKTRRAFFESTINRFWAKVARRRPDECWLWIGTRNVPNKIGERYGTFGVTEYGGKCVNYRAHRLAYMLCNGEIPEDFVIMHTCDTPLCCNPAHLRAATQYENAQDMTRKGRVAQGSDHYDRRLEPNQVLEIFDNKADSHSELGRRYGVNATTIIKIRQGKTWRRLLTREGRIGSNVFPLVGSE